MTFITLFWHGVLIAVLGYAAYKDVQTLTIPLIPVLGAIGSRLIYLIIVRDYIHFILPACILFLAFILFALLTNMGGGDSLIAGMVGLYLGTYGFYAILFGCVAAIAYLIIRQKIHKDNQFNEYPFVPFTFFGCSFIEMLMLGGLL